MIRLHGEIQKDSLLLLPHVRQEYCRSVVIVKPCLTTGLGFGFVAETNWQFRTAAPYASQFSE